MLMCFPLRRLTVPLVTLLSTTVIGIGIRGAVADEPSKSDYDRLVHQLGDDSFPLREAAARQLMASGLAAKPALIRGMKHPELEVRMEAHRLLVQVMQADFEAFLEAFVSAEDKSRDYHLPGWKLFREQLGDNKASRQLFANMVRSESALLDAVAQREEAAPLQSLLIRRLQELADARSPNGVRRSVSVPSLATVLFVAGRPEAPHDVTVESRLYSILMQSATKQAVLLGSRSELLKQLLGHWVEQQIDRSRTYHYAPRLILTFNLRDIGLKVGRKTLENPNATSSMIPYAAIAIAKFGARKDAQYLLPHLNNTTVCHSWSNPQLKKEPIRIQVRDVVLALLVRMTGQEPKDYGYQLLAADPETIYRIYTFGFLEDKQRDEALAKWREWHESHRAEWEESPNPVKTANK